MGTPVVWLILGVVLLLLGAAFIAGLFDWLLDVAGFIFIFIGIIAIVMSLVNLFSGRNRG